MLDDDETAALDLLLDVAKSDTGQARRCADFLLAWWDSGSCGSFDLTNVWGLDTNLADAMVTVFRFISENQGIYPDKLGLSLDFQKVIRQWRPELDTSE